MVSNPGSKRGCDGSAPPPTHRHVEHLKCQAPTSARSPVVRGFSIRSRHGIDPGDWPSRSASSSSTSPHVAQIPPDDGERLCAVARSTSRRPYDVRARCTCRSLGTRKQIPACGDANHVRRCHCGAFRLVTQACATRRGRLPVSTCNISVLQALASPKGSNPCSRRERAVSSGLLKDDGDPGGAR